MNITVTLSNSEKIAYRMITALPDVASKVANGTSTIDVKDMHSYMHRLVLGMEVAEAIRRENYIDVTPTGEE